jgi:hypothetical protein
MTFTKECSVTVPLPASFDKPITANYMINIERGELRNDSQVLSISRPECSLVSRPKAHNLLVFKSGPKVEAAIVEGDVQFDQLLICMSVLSEKMVNWPDDGEARNEHFDLGYARVAASTLKTSGTLEHSLTLQIFQTPATDLAPRHETAEVDVRERQMKTTVEEMRSWGAIFSRLDQAKLEPAFVSDTEEWCVAELLMNWSKPNHGYKADKSSKVQDE